MKKISEIISSTIISLYEGEEMGIIYNITFDYKLKKCKYACILNEETNVMRILKFNDIYRIGTDCIYIKNSTITELQSNVDKEMEYCKTPLNLKIYNVSGEYMGTSQDIEIDDNYYIKNIITSTGEIIPTNQIINIGSVIIVGSKKINLSKFKPERTIKITKQTEEEKVVILSVDKPTPPKNQNKIITDSRFLMGRKIIQDILAFNGELIARNGSTITKDILNKASNYGKLVEVARYSTNK